MAYSLSFSNQALKELEKISEPFYTNVKFAITALAENPLPYGYKKLKNRQGYRIRIGDYRVIYEIFDKVLNVEVITIGHRRDVYQ